MRYMVGFGPGRFSARYKDKFADLYDFLHEHEFLQMPAGGATYVLGPLTTFEFKGMGARSLEHCPFCGKDDVDDWYPAKYSYKKIGSSDDVATLSFTVYKHAAFIMCAECADKHFKRVAYVERNRHDENENELEDDDE